MVMKIDSRKLQSIDAVALLGICIVLIEAFYYQLVQRELPCAFCNLIRVGFMLLGSGFLLNMRFGTNAWNYVLSAFGALIGSLISLLFMFAKAPKWTTPTGSAVFGLHMYTWSYIMFTAAIMFCVVMLAFSAAAKESAQTKKGQWYPPLKSVATAVFLFLVGANLVSAFLQNGFHTFKAGGQKHYQMLYDGDVMKP
jgi:disulfide bond formation protein DsbB